MSKNKICKSSFWCNVFEYSLVLFIYLYAIWSLKKIKQIFKLIKIYTIKTNIKPAKTNDATVEINPERNALNGNVPTKQQ